MATTSDRLRQIALRLTDYYLLWMLLAFPLFSGLSGYHNITVSKYLFFALSTGLWLLILLFCRIRARKKPDFSALSSAQRAILLFAAAAMLSACCSPFGLQTVIGTSRYDGLLTLLLYCGIFWGISQYAVFQWHHSIAFSIATILCCLIAILQLFCLDPLALFPTTLTYYDSGIYYTGRFLGTIGNTNLLAAFLCLGIPFFIAQYLTDSRTSRWYWMLPAACGLFILVRSASTGGLVALGLCGLVSVPLLLHNKARLLSAFRAAAFMAFVAGCATAMVPHYVNHTVTFQITICTRTWLCLIAAVLCTFLSIFGRWLPPCSAIKQSRLLALCCGLAVCIGLSIVYWYPFQSGSLYELSRILHGELADAFGSNRIRIWRAVLALIPEHPLLGSGPDTLAARLDLTFSRLVTETGQTLTVRVDNAHNEYLGHFVHLGALGLAAYLTAITASCKTWFRRRDDIPVAAIGCAVVCYWAEGLFGLGLALTNPLLWIFWGLLEYSNGPSLSLCRCPNR